MAATIGGAKALYSAQRQFKSELNEVMIPVAQRASGILLSAAGADGTIDPRQTQSVIDRITPLVSRVFVGADGKSAYQNTYEPLSPYATLFNKWYVYNVVNIVQSHVRTMRRLLTNAPDVRAWLESSTQTEVIRTNPLLDYDPYHLFVDPRGYTLSQKIWRNETEIRVKMDAMLTDYIRQGVSAVGIANDFEQFLLPGARGIRTNKPYGSSLSYPAVRLGRTELSAAFGRVTIATSRANPFVSGINWQLSRSHRDSDECDANAAGNPHPVDNVPTYPNHPNELCSLVPVVTDKPAEVIADLRAMMQRGDPAPLTPLSWRRFLTRLLGAYLAAQVFQQFQSAF